MCENLHGLHSGVSTRGEEYIEI